MKFLCALAVLGCGLSISSKLIADPCPVITIAVPKSLTSTIPNTCFDVGYVAGTAFVDYVVDYRISVQAGRAIGARMHTDVQQPLLFLLDSDFNALVADVGDSNEAAVVFPNSIGGTYYLVAGVPADQVGASFTLDVTAATAPGVLDHVMAKDVETVSPYDPISRSRYFLPSDPVAWSWLKVGPISGIHRIESRFYPPREGSVPYVYASSIVGDAGAYDWWKDWEGIYVSGHLPAQTLGNWRVDVSVDGTIAYSEPFVITTTPPACDPLQEPRCGHLVKVPPILHPAQVHR